MHHLVIAPDDPRIAVTGAAMDAVVEDAAGRRRRWRRPLASPAGYDHDNPGLCLHLRARGPLTAHLRYGEGHVSATARNGIGLVLRDGVQVGTFAPVATAVQRAVEVVAVPLADDGAWHDHVLVMPYGDSVELLGFDGPGELAPAAPPPRSRWVAYGDSVTQGFDAGHVGCTWPWLVAAARGWEAVNLGIGGRATTPDDAAAIAGLRPDLVSIAIGVNDWQGGVPPELYRERLAATVAGVRAGAPAARIAVIAPLSVAASWRPAAAIAPLAAYREVAAAVAAAAGVEAVDGTDLIPPDPALFAPVAVHPNDAGFAAMAAALAARLFR